MARGIRTDVDQGKLNQLVGDLDRLIGETCGSGRNDARTTGARAEAAKFDVFRAANAVSSAALGSDPGAIERARNAVDIAMRSCELARIGGTRR
jgi:hypothetical protein